MALSHRDWVPAHCEALVQRYHQQTTQQSSHQTLAQIETLANQANALHTRQCFNLNPATNVMNPRAEALLSSGIGTRPSLGYPGDKYETGLSHIERIEVIAASLCAEVFDAKFAEIRVPSGAIANLYAFMATCQPGDTIIAPPASIGGHVTHHLLGCAGLFGLKSVAAPVASDGYSVDLAGLSTLAQDTRPKLITLGGSLNLFEHPVAKARDIADRVGAKLLFDAAHQCGIIAGKAWSNPLEQGAHLMTMSTYKSLGGPPSGLIVTNEPDLAQRLDAIAFPGMTANFDAAKSAALAVTMVDWRDFGQAYAAEMITCAQSLAQELQALGIEVFTSRERHTSSHQFAIKAAPYGGGQAASKRIEAANFLTCGIGLPIAPVDGDMNGIRLGTPELVRWGLTGADMPRLAKLISQALTSTNPASLAREVQAWREQFSTLHFVHSASPSSS